MPGKQSDIAVGVIGAGYWGPNLIRNFFATSGCLVKRVVDLDMQKLTWVKKNYPGISVSKNSEDIFNDTQIDAVVIATPPSTHFNLGSKALQKGKHLLLEKPMASSVAQAQKLIDIAQQKKRILMVDHTFLYTSAVQKIRELFTNKEIGRLKYFDSTRINLGLFQSDSNVIWDLAPHDISIINHLVDENPISIQTTGVSHLDNGIENIAYLTMKYQSGLIAHFNCSWASPVKIRKILIGGDKKMVVYDDIEPSEKVKVYDTGYKANKDKDRNRILVDYRIGDIYIPKLDGREALAKMAADFIDSIKNDRPPLSDMYTGLKVVKILELSQKSLAGKGKAVLYK